MNQKHFLGKRVSSFEKLDSIGPITGVAIIVDEDTEIFYGTDSGYVFELECPYGTETMAKNILADISGRTYIGYEAEGALLSPDAELGDGVTVSGIYSVLAHKTVTFGPSHSANISAPSTGEIEHEYPYLGSVERTVNRKIAQTRSLITKTAEEISLEVSDLADQYTKVSVTLDGLTVTDPNGTTVVRGDMIATDNLYVNAANVTGTLTANQINLTGAITFDDLNDDVSGSITNAQSTANGAASTASSAWSIARQIANGTFSGGTFIDGKKIYSPTIYAENFSVVPTSVTAFGQTGGSFNLYGYYGNTLYHFLAVEYYAGDSPAVWFKSPDDAACYMQFDDLSFYGSNVDFTGATVTGLTATFG